MAANGDIAIGTSCVSFKEAGDEDDRPANSEQPYKMEQCPPHRVWEASLMRLDTNMPRKIRNRGRLS